MIRAFLAKYALLGAGAALLLALAATGVQTVRLALAQAELAEVERMHSDERRQAEETARIASENYRAEESRRAEANRKAADETQALLQAARADAHAADAALVRLQARYRALAAAGRAAAPDRATAGLGAPADATADMLADVLGRLGTDARRIAEFADAANAAGLECERRHDALTAGGSS